MTSESASSQLTSAKVEERGDGGANPSLGRRDTKGAGHRWRTSNAAQRLERHRVGFSSPGGVHDDT
jgi:hypothetical protein